MQEENKLTSAYQKLYASAMVEFDGKTMPLPKLGPYKESQDRAVRRAAYEAEGKFFDEHQQELDELFDKLVKNRTEQAKRMGHENYLQLGYDRLGRNCYDPKKVEALPGADRQGHGAHRGAGQGGSEKAPGARPPALL